MAKFNEEKTLTTISELPVDDLISFYYKVKAILNTNLEALQTELTKQADTYKNVKDKINGN
jgi:hypothetical protein